MRLTNKIKAEILDHARSCYPSECCGLIVDNIYHPCENQAVDKTAFFSIDPKRFVELSQHGEIQAIVHSHPDGDAEPSEMDLIHMSMHDIDWVICGFGDSVTGEPYHDIKRHKPKPYHSNLVGRDYAHGVQDCYSLIRDYYKRELDIELPDFEREDAWWEDENHEPLYERNFENAGFYQVDNLQKHDVILCRVGRTYHVNHALVFLGDGKLTSERADDIIGDSIMLHHPHGGLSVREIYGDSWQRRTAVIVRHRGVK